MWIVCWPLTTNLCTCFVNIIGLLPIRQLRCPPYDHTCVPQYCCCTPSLSTFIYKYSNIDVHMYVCMYYVQFLAQMHKWIFSICQISTKWRDTRPVADDESWILYRCSYKTIDYVSKIKITLCCPHCRSCTLKFHTVKMSINHTCHRNTQFSTDKCIFRSHSKKQNVKILIKIAFSNEKTSIYPWIFVRTKIEKNSLYDYFVCLCILSLYSLLWQQCESVK